MRVIVQEKIKTVFWWDTAFWFDNRIEITKWLNDHDYILHDNGRGFFEYKDDKHLALFLLRWS